MAYRGLVVELPVAQGGLHGAQNASQVPATHVITARNITFENGTWQKEGGAVKYNAVAIWPYIVNGHDWWPDSATQRMVVYSYWPGAGNSGSIYKDDGTGTFNGQAPITAGLANSNVAVFVEGGKEAAANPRKLFLFTGTNQVRVLSGDGGSTFVITTPPADWATNYPSFGLIHEGRLWGFGNPNDPHRVYYSTTTNHEDFTGAGSGSLSIFPGEGQKLMAGVSFRGLLILWKYPAGIYIVDTRDPSTANWKVWRHTGSVGTGSPLAVVIVEDDVLFPDQVGNIQRLSAVQEFGSIGSQNVSDIDQINALIRSDLDVQTFAEKVRGVYYARKREVHFAVPAINSSDCDRRLVLDMNGVRPRWRLSDRDVCVSIWTRLDPNKNQELVSGDNAGFVWRMDRSARNKAGFGYQAEIQTAYMDLSHVDPTLAAKNKIGQFLELIFDPVGAWDLEVDVIWDGVTKQTLRFNMGVGGAALGSFTLDTDALASESVISQRKRIVGSGKNLSLVFRNNTADQDFSIARALLYFKLGDER